MAQHIPYLEQGKLGRVGALDYAVGTITMFLLWVVVQVIFQFPMLFLSPDLLENTIAQAQEQAQANAGVTDAQGGGFSLVSLMIIGVLGAPLAYLSARTTTGRTSQVFAGVAWLLVALAVIGLVPTVAGMTDASNQQAMDDMLALIGSSPIAYGLTLLSFIGGILGAWFVTRSFHGRTFRSLITAAQRIRWSRMIWTCFMTLGLWALIQGGMVLLGLSEVVPNARASQILPFLAMTILFIPVQCAAEEVMFRGYLNQALARFIPSFLIVILISSTLFGALHLANPEIAVAKAEGTFWLTFGFYILFGMVFSVLVWIDNGLESAIGVHMANNAFVATFINLEDSALPVPSLYLTPLESSGASGLLFIASMVLVIGAVWLTRRPLAEAASPLSTSYVASQDHVAA